MCSKEQAEQHEVSRGNLHNQFTRIDHGRSPKRHERYHGNHGGPHGPTAILKHGQQHAGKGDEQQQAVERSEQQIAHGIQVAGIDVEHQPPHMRQRCYGKERCRPVAQPLRWRNARRNGIFPSQQQVECSNQRHYTRYAVEDEKQYPLYRYLPDYIHFYLIHVQRY